ncbi:hypothetical protein A3J43_03405 [Candidatus Uhrbacteria bacterium RIFCSPHIGHO2_12_FULL_54_23]|uniref:Uncharacterized protein n=3 Tax=Candidatus Uhriibacteriota TaxID=1752732 RepID=A0A1F7UN55_9BACT|nr:MAG: hypothetical protein A3J43_03405 [Candidatus Uhrbacteria bacterium RIFCSPHIGHO2_12_FULL_54_23]OGL85632.1 MAG: hypothetical protein A3B36_01905 [Candidatus Uhrbacteria bacterium RIFCSPLOWO2_01_FULL_55_36]OGL91142.1 MAG: hypothetical protein A3J36_03095 [Candidatus Uhrbacteria bacterium RIFCSPLOWO2_02_FULL_54_37]
MRSKDDHQQHMALMLMRQCPACRVKYAAEHVRVLSASERGSLVSFTCGACKLGVLVVIAPMPFGLMGTGVPTDCSPDEALRFMNAEEVSADDVIEAHTLLKNSKS